MEILFYLPGILFVISGVPQTIKLLKTKNSESISIWMYVLTCIAIIIIVIDAFIHHNNSILFSNLASLLVAGTNTILTIKYRKRVATS